ncbi:F0F1 ATP synthase subunit B [Qiania dongpingensis]|uniref:ATP synthase subunit b n=1 Tax=Qiania dongpingensis TaxID=2763669 RepID=A0A7G9G1I3_9FIRM|nr:F0F1 ATP synthase subunit B [Qiania dongpingensis]QNM04665.1 F0F1 ATP synthase subunit B [Qiania dongpingensis]
MGAILAAGNFLAASGEEYTRILGLDLQLIHDALLLGVNIFILFFALSYLLFNPVRNMLEKRSEKIRTDLDTAAEDKRTAAGLKTEYEARIKDIDKEAEAILAEARRKALKREEEILENAKAESARIIERAGREAELEKKKALDDMKQEMITIASMMAGKAVEASMDVKIQDELIERTLKEIGDDTWQS